MRERQGGSEMKRQEKNRRMLAGFRFFFSLLPSLHRIVPQVESFHRILCATGALERDRERALYEMSLEWME